jgi:hypothetical protein
LDYHRIPLVLSLLFVPLLAGSADAMVRKCRDAPGGIPIRNTTPLLLVNGEEMGDLRPAVDGASSLDIGSAVPIKREEILRIDVVCLEVVEAGVKTRRAAVAVITRAGAVPFMKSQLQALVHQQEEYRARTGAYAPNLTSLGFFATRAPLPIVMQLKEGGWSAKVELDGVTTGCQVVVEGTESAGGTPPVACGT